jgi:CHAT domain-containing protein
MYGRARPILEAAVEILPRLSPRFLKRSDAQFNLAQFSSITSRAVSLALEDGDKSFRPLQLLELGRGILATLQLEVRSDISVLRASHEDLAQQFQKLRNQIDSPFKGSLPYSEDHLLADFNSYSAREMSKAIAERRALLKRFEDLLQQIRSLSGHENFLQGPSETELRSLAQDGPIVVFNVSDIRSDAFLIKTADIHCVRLPSLTLDSIKHFTKASMGKVKQRKLNPTGSDAQFKAKETLLEGHGDINAKRKATLVNNEGRSSDMRTMLKWLWDAAVNPVLEELGFTETPDNEPWPHIWWITSGFLARLPIHAAGDHVNGSNRNAMDRVISSYVPTLKSLAYSREKVKNQFGNDEVSKALLVAMPITPSQSALPCAETEVKEVGALIPDSITKIIVLQPSKSTVLDSLAECRVIHFACHGESNPDDPSKSRLLLQDWKDDPLSVADITALNLRNVAFAYLSACSAADSRVESLLDEGIHLAGAFLLAGFPSVVGTLWHISDEHSATVAVDVYRELCEKSGRINPDEVARALHLAVRKLRSEMEGKSENSLFWSPYIHMGV